MKLTDYKYSDLKTYSKEELTSLASEIRGKIIDTVSVNGGHLSSNLGVVELSIALHKVFDSPLDKIIFDVSHQTYAHKILTDRLDIFDSLRKYDGMSGFSKKDESIHDVFEAGHSSTSISAGLGFLEAKKTNPGSIGEVVCVIGDASISNGLAFEALNYLGSHKEEKMIIIINDNNMSVSKNVGAIAKRYNNIRIKKSLKLLRKITPIRIKHALQYYSYQTDLFTALGFKYFENIDGHDISELVKYLTFAKQSTKTIILHVKTTKGKGYKYSEEDKVGSWHAVEPFNKETGIANNKYVSFGNVMCDTLIDIAKKDKDNLLRVISPAMFLGNGIAKFEQEFPEKSIDVGIAEENACVMASAMAQNGLKPVIFMYSTFLQRAYDELLHDIARSNTKVIFCIDHSGIVSGDGSTHQGIYDAAFIQTIPGFKIYQPYCDADAKAMLEYVYNYETSPVIIRYPKGVVPHNDKVFDNTYNYHILKEHSKNYVLTYGPLVNEALTLSNTGVIYAPVTTYIDNNLLKTLSNKGVTLYVWEEVIDTLSLGNKIINYCYKNNINLSIKTLCLPDTYLDEGSVKEIRSKYHMDIIDLEKLIKEGK